MDESSPYTHWFRKGPRPQAATHLAIEDYSEVQDHPERTFPAWDRSPQQSHGSLPWNGSSSSTAWMAGSSQSSASNWKCAECNGENQTEAFNQEVHVHEDGAFDTDPDSDDMNVEDPELDHWVGLCCEDTSERLWDDLRQQAHDIYVVAKRRWRKVMGRPTRRKGRSLVAIKKERKRER